MLYVGCRGKSRVSDVLADLKSATHYFHLRDLLYYTYTAPGSTPWTFDEGKGKILTPMYHYPIQLAATRVWKSR